MFIALSSLAGCALAPASREPGARDAAKPDPSKAEVSLPAAGGWLGTLVCHDDVGVWTVEAAKIFPAYGCPEVIGLDDKGRCIVLWSYSGKWTPRQTVEDLEWLGALAVADVDPRTPGTELYTGGKRGNLYRIVADDHLTFESRVIARMPGEELHTAVGGDLDPEQPGNELLVFTGRGEVHLLRATSSTDGSFDTRRLPDLSGRVRQARALLDAEGRVTPWLAGVARSGELLLMRLTGEQLETRVLSDEPMGLGRIAQRPPRAGEPRVLYITRDDGLVLRFEEQADQSWTRELVYAGPQGPRGIAAGHFVADPEVETLAVFGYGKRVQLLSRAPGGAWSAETIFEDLDKGHWLATAELDGRNGTDELLCSGYSGRIVLLARPPGYARDGAPQPIPTDPDAAPATPTASGDTDADGLLPRREPDVPRLAVRAKLPSAERLSTLRYRGGFETKSLVFETLVRRDEQGVIVPQLAASWSFEDEGRRLILRLRDGARYHDGTPVDAPSVAVHLRRWTGLPEHAWLPVSGHVTSVSARSRNEVVLEFDSPQAALPELCAINPGSVMAPGCFDREGELAATLGSGPYRLTGSQGEGRVLQYERVAPGPGPARLELALFGARDPPPIDALLAGAVDGVLDGWAALLPRAGLAEWEARPDIELHSGPGSSVIYLSFRLSEGAPTGSAPVRRTLAAAVDRAALIERVERGHAQPCDAWAAPVVTSWPRPRTPGRGERAPAALVPPLRLLIDSDDPRQPALAAALAEQWLAAGLRIEAVGAQGESLTRALADGAFDLRLEQTWGLPYDPELSLAARFLEPPAAAAAAGAPSHGRDARVGQLVSVAFAEPDAARRSAIYQQVQELLDSEALIVPLYVPLRLMLGSPAAPQLQLTPDLYRITPV